MEIIDELETTKEKFTQGVLDIFLRMVNLIPVLHLRTAVAKNNKFYVQAGAGIVADSKPIMNMRKPWIKRKL